ncbi:MAG: Crp/Fnr family transcriptional regulator [Pseudomonadota bacterium]
MTDVEGLTPGAMLSRPLESPRFLDTLTPTDRALLISKLTMRRCRRDEVVLTQQDEDTVVFVTLDGLARATIFSDDGKIVTYRDIHAGDMFGEMAAIDGAPRSASVVAVTDLQVGVLTSAQFEETVESSKSFRWALLRYFSQQTRSLTQRIFEFSTMLARERLIQELLRLAGVGDAEDGAFVISPAPTHFDLAARISTHREAVSREMSALTKSGLISKDSGYLHLHDVRGLRKHMSFQC